MWWLKLIITVHCGPCNDNDSTSRPLYQCVLPDVKECSADLRPKRRQYLLPQYKCDIYRKSFVPRCLFQYIWIAFFLQFCHVAVPSMYVCCMWTNDSVSQNEVKMWRRTWHGVGPRPGMYWGGDAGRTPPPHHPFPLPVSREGTRPPIF